MTPNLFILGAGKCGTTSLYNMLRAHNEIHVSRVKEPSFFCSYFQIVKNPIDYFKLFKSDARYRVDASHVYLSNPESAPVIRALFPDAKFIVILRNPKARAHSLYKHMRRFLYSDGFPLEQESTFESALMVEETRYLSKYFFNNCRHYFWNFMYCRSSMYDEQLTRYINNFDINKFLIISLAELSANPDETCSKIGAFLGVDAGPLLFHARKIANASGIEDRYSRESEAFMDKLFDGLTDRTDKIIGRALDWSM